MTVRQIFNVNHASTPRLLSVNRWIFVYNDISLIHSKVISVFKLNWILIKISGTQLNRCWNLFMGILRIKSEKFKCWLIEFIVYRIKQMSSPDQWIYIYRCMCECLTKTLAKRLSNSLWSGIGIAARFRTLACRTWWFCIWCGVLKLLCKLFDALVEFRLMVALGVTFVIAVLAKSPPVSLCVGDAAVCAAVSCDDDAVIPIFFWFYFFSSINYISSPLARCWYLYKFKKKNAEHFPICCVLAF